MSGVAGNPHTGLKIGRTLRWAREKRGLSLQQVEEATKIRTRYLRDLENEKFDVLPAVYMLGSLKTYAEHLGLDGAAMTTEFKRRQTSLQAEHDEAREAPLAREPRGLLASLARLVGITEPVEDEAGTMAPVHRPGLYVSLVVVLIFILATYLASSFEGEGQPPVSQVREPKISQVPSRAALISNVEDNERNAEDVNKENQPEKPAETPAKDDKIKAEQSGQEEYAPRTAQVPSSSSSASASASAGASPASTGSVSAPATATPAPTRVRPEPAAREQPGGGGMAAPAGPPARVSGSRSLHETQAGPGDGVPNKVKKVVESAW